MSIRRRFSYKNAVKIFILSLTAILIGLSPVTIKADDASPVEVVYISYDTGYICIKQNGNTKVYYSQTDKNTWYEVEGSTVGDPANGCLLLDISWISEAKDYNLTLKGDKNETNVDIVLPASNTSLKVKLDNVEGTLVFTNDDGADKFEWRKSTSYNWQTSSITNQADFLKEVEELRVKGGKIIVRIPGKAGTSSSDTGSRPSKSITVSIPKRANAPSIKVDINKLTLNTTAAMEYIVCSINGAATGNIKWNDCESKMPLKDIAPEIFASAVTAGKDVVIAIRKASTEKSGYSKEAYVSIPAQAVAPSSADLKLLTQKTSSKFNFSVQAANVVNVFQYAVVKDPKNIPDDSSLQWKSIASAKQISFAVKSYPEGSLIYIRTKGTAQSVKTNLKLPSAYTVISISYTSEP